MDEQVITSADVPVAALASEVVELAPPCASVVEVQGAMTIRTYADGSIQRNLWATAEDAQEYADSVVKQEG